MLEHERRWWARGHLRIAGIDEAGRGPLAGPVIAACVTASREDCERLFAAEWKRLNDSKRLTDKSRRTCFDAIYNAAGIGVGVGRCEPAEIDDLNILRATHLAMARALAALPDPPPDHVLVDGLPVKGLPVQHEAIIGGDGKSLLIAAASIVAKVTRDNEMLALDRQFPRYGFAQHKGYGTRAHLDAIQQFGPCPIHRRSFAPVRQMGLALE